MSGNRCVKIGAPAVEPLIAALKDDDKDVRKGVGEALVGLYQAGRLDSKYQQIILSKRHMIERKHLDETTFSWSSDCHSESGT